MRAIVSCEAFLSRGLLVSLAKANLLDFGLILNVVVKPDCSGLSLGKQMSFLATKLSSKRGCQRAGNKGFCF